MCRKNNIKLKNDIELSISKATKREASSIIDYLNLVGGESNNLLFGKNEFHMSIEEEETFIDNINSSKDSALFTGKIDNKIVCLGRIQALKRERIKHQSTISIYVKKNYWYSGIGTELMKMMIEFAKNTGTTEILHLGVKSDNANAIKLYKKMGFKQTGLYENYFKIDGIYSDKVLMSLYL